MCVCYVYVFIHTWGLHIWVSVCGSQGWHLAILGWTLVSFLMFVPSCFNKQTQILWLSYCVYDGGITRVCQSTHVEVKGKPCEDCTSLSAYVGPESEFWFCALVAFPHWTNSPAPTLFRDKVSLWSATYQASYYRPGSPRNWPVSTSEDDTSLHPAFYMNSGDKLTSSYLSGKHFANIWRHAFFTRRLQTHTIFTSFSSCCL